MLLAAFSGCAIADCNKTVDLGNMPTNAVLHAEKHCSLTLRLDSLPGNGLHWQLQSYDPRYVSLLSPRSGHFVGAGVLGAPETQEIAIKTLSSGKTVVVLEYIRFGHNVLKVRHLRLLVK